MYYLAAWVNGSLDPSDEKLQYSVLVNDEKEEYKIRAGESHPHSIDFGDKLFFLSSGINKITFQTKKPNCPNVEFIKVSLDEQNHQISSEMYDKYIDEISKQKLPDNYNEIKEEAMAEESSNESLKSSPPDPQCEYDYELDEDFAYTYYLNIWLSTGTVTFETKYATSDPVMYLFFFGEPTLYTWSDDDGGSSPYNSKIVANITESGLYTVLITRKSTSVAGTCSIYKNSTLINSNCAVSGTPIQCIKTVTSGLNWFTADLTGDSHIWLEDQTGTPGKIIEYNDDCTLPSDFSWGNNARIREYVSTNVRALIVSSHSSWNPTGNCDVYMNCKNSSTSLPKPTDGVQSAPATAAYRCYSWSGGRTDLYNFKPTQSNSPWRAYNHPGMYYELYSFDNFYGNRDEEHQVVVRYTGDQVMNFSRDESPSSTSCVALWGSSPLGSFTHASVKKPANNQPHGYDWESKHGASERFFHPKDALSDYYGSIQQTYSYSGYSSGTQPIIESSAKYNNEQLSSDKLSLMNGMVETCLDIEKFEKLYESWENTWNSPELIHHSNPIMLANNEHYLALVDYCKTKGKRIWPLVFSKYIEGDDLNLLLIDELTEEEYSEVMIDVIKRQNAECSRNHTVPSPRANTVNYISLLLGELEKEFERTQKSDIHTEIITLNKNQSINLYPNPAENNVNIQIVGMGQTEVVIKICDLSGKMLKSVSKNMLGDQTFNFNIEDIPDGIYLCKIEFSTGVYTTKLNVKR